MSDQLKLGLNSFPAAAPRSGRTSRQMFLDRRRLLQFGGVGLLAAGSSSLLAACKGANSATASSASTTLTVGVYQEPDTLDPAATGLAMVAMMITHIFDPLIWWLPDSSGTNQFYPGLAKSYKASADARTYTFTLRQDVDFHDGTHFDAKAVKANFDHVVDPATKSRSAASGLGPDYDKVEIVDDYTVRIHFKQPNASFLHNVTAITLGMQSPAAIKQYGAAGVSNHPVGTGPFKFVEYQAQDHVSLERYDKYAWAPEPFALTGKAKLEKLDFKILLDTNARYNALRSGQIQIAQNLDPDTIASIQKSKQFTHYNVPSTGQPYGLPINIDKAPTDDIRVRQAILHAVDQKSLNEKVLHGAYTPAYNILTPSTPGYVKANDSMFAYDPAKSKSLLDQAGWTAGADGSRSKGGKKLEVEILIQSANGFDLPAQFVVNALQQVGISASTKSQPFTTAAASYNQGVENLAAVFFYSLDAYLLHTIYDSSQIKSGFNWSHLDDPSIDRAINKANTIADPDASAAAYSKISTDIMKKALFLPLWNVSGVYDGVTNLKGIKFGPTGYSYFHSASFT
ncbi:ABC transporter substrate-binding protein [Microlunatus endophyticus]|nr:ABC transporter substrate-binding protein [Microlunatus endophyticus]